MPLRERIASRRSSAHTALRPWMGAADGNLGGPGRRSGPTARTDGGAGVFALVPLPASPSGIARTCGICCPVLHRKRTLSYMKLRFILPFIFGLALLGAGCAAAPAAPKTDAPPVGAEASKLTNYTESISGISFVYPSAWGNVMVSREVPAVDRGKRVFLRFSDNNRVSLAAVSADFAEGVGEGTPDYFTLSDRAQTLDTATAAARAFPQRFDILFWKKFVGGVYQMIHDASYARHQVVISYLLTDLSAPGFDTLMVNYRLGEPRDARWSIGEAQQLLTQPAESEQVKDIETFVKSIRHGSAYQAGWWKQVKSRFVLKVPASWRVTESDAGNAALIKIFSTNSAQSDAQIFIQSPQEIGSDVVTTFDQWVKNGGENVGQSISNFVSQGMVVVDGVTLLKKFENDSVVAYYARLQTSDGEVFFRYAFDARNAEKDQLESVLRNMSFSPSDSDISKAQIIP